MTKTTQPPLSAHNISFGYRHAPILKELSLTLQPGELLALAGPNGCGKTTLLKQLSGVLTPTHGAIYLHGKALHQMKPRIIAQHLAALEQHIQVDFAFNVEELVFMGRLPHMTRLQSPSQRDRQQVEHAMKRTGTLDLATRQIDQLSSGERQRVWLAMALAQEPRILLLDEPTSHLDIQYQMEIMELLHQLSREGLTIAMSMHELHLIAQFADRVALIHQGLIHAIGTAEQVLTEAHIQHVFQVNVVLIRDAQQQIIGVLPQRTTPSPKSDLTQE